MPIKAIVRITLMICFATTLLLYVSCSQLACSDFTGESSCNSQTDTKCKWVANSTTAGACNCASAVQLDILFAIDASGTVGPDGWEIQKEFIGTLVLQDINNGSKIGFVLFSTKVNFSKSIQTWQTEELDNYVSGLYWQQGYTNTPGAVNASILEFSGSNPAGAINPYVPDPERQKILIMITDGIPCLPELLGGCPQSVCQYQTPISINDIRIIIVGVKDGPLNGNEIYIECLVETDDDFIYVPAFTTQNFESIRGSLSDALCPIVNQTTQDGTVDRTNHPTITYVQLNISFTVTITNRTTERIENVTMAVIDQAYDDFSYKWVVIANDSVQLVVSFITPNRSATGIVRYFDGTFADDIKDELGRDGIEAEVVIVIIYVTIEPAKSPDEEEGDVEGTFMDEISDLQRITLLLVLLLVFFIGVSCVDGRVLRRNDYFNAGSLAKCSLQMLDTLLDVLFAVRITKHPRFA
eukprot:174032_1